MADPRYDAARAKLRRFLPPPAPDSGWGYARQRIEAEFLGVTTDDQASTGEAMMLMPATLQRTDTAPTDWTANPYTWAFSPSGTTYTGAQGEWLDLWGTILAVPREPGEPDGLYGPRILSEILRPTQTNTGLAQALDEGLGVVGTQVHEAADVLIMYRLNSPGIRSNSSTTAITKRLNMAGSFQGTSTAACFVIQLPSGAQAPYDDQTVARIANRAKAAGTRLAGIYTSNAGTIIAPNAVTVGISATAYIAPITGGSYAWSISNGTITSGQGTNIINFSAADVGAVGLSVKVIPPAGGMLTYWKPVQAYLGVSPTVSTALYQYAGTLGVTASIPMPNGSAATLKWTATGVNIVGANDQPTVTFDVGPAQALATITVAVANAAGATGTSTITIKVIPYTSPATAATTTLPPNASQTLTMPLGWAYDIVSIQTDRPAWVRIYNTMADLTADSARTVTTDPSPNTAIVWEGITTASMLTIPAAPGVKGVNGDTPRGLTAYVSVTNLDTITAAVNVTITRTETRTSGTF